MIEKGDIVFISREMCLGRVLNSWMGPGPGESSRRVRWWYIERIDRTGKPCCSGPGPTTTRHRPIGPFARPSDVTKALKRGMKRG